MIDAIKIQRLVGSIYKNTFKVFEVNSPPGESNSVFVSLGITTQIETIEKIKEILGSLGKYETRLVELESRKNEKGFINTISQNTNPSQYKLEDLPDNLMSREEAYFEISRLRNEIDPVNSSLSSIVKCGVAVQKLQALLDKLDDTDKWDSHMIQRLDDGNYRIFHLYVNYSKQGDLEKRIGILINEKVRD